MRISKTECKEEIHIMERTISDKEVVRLARAAVELDLKKKKVLGIPAVVYDRNTQLIYEQYGDGTRKVIGHRSRKGRYSERKAKV